MHVLTARLALVLAAATATTLVAAQKTATLRFAEPGQRTFWTGPMPLLNGPNASTPSTEKVVQVDLSRAGPQDHVFVWDGPTGNVASKPVAKAAQGWTIVPDDYRMAFRVAVKVEHQGKPVSSAAVSLTEGGRTRQQMLAPPMNGIVSFYGVRFGPVKVAVRYDSKGQTKLSPTVAIDVQRQRSETEPIVVVALSDPVDTVGPKNEPTKPAATGATAEPSLGERIGGILVYLAGAALAVGAGYALLRFVQKKPEKVEELLGKVGVALPSEDDGSGPTPVAAPKAPEPIAPIVLGPAPPAPSAAINPRLVADDGSVFLIPEGDTPVGREVSEGLVLPGESTVSRSHAIITRSGDEVRIRDSGSTNGTFVNGARIDAEVALRPGDDVQFGAVRRRYEV